MRKAGSPTLIERARRPGALTLASAHAMLAVMEEVASHDWSRMQNIAIPDGLRLIDVMTTAAAAILDVERERLARLPLADLVRLIDTLAASVARDWPPYILEQLTPAMTAMGETIGNIASQ